MTPENDFKELLELLNSKSVDFIIVGAYALAFHGAPRFTGDLDILVNPTPSNSKRLISALDEFGFGSAGLTEADFVELDRVIQLGVPPVRIDFLTSITALSWQTVEKGKVPGEYFGIPVDYIGRSDYIINKRAVGRIKDLSDIEAINAVK